MADVVNVNKGGRPKSRESITAQLRHLLFAGDDYDDSLPCAYQIAKRLLEEAQKGEPWAVKEVLDRTEGKPVQTNVVKMAQEVERLTDRLADIVAQVIANYVEPATAGRIMAEIAERIAGGQDSAEE